MKNILTFFLMMISFSVCASEVRLNYGSTRFESEGILFEVEKQRAEDKMTAHGYDVFNVKMQTEGEWKSLMLNNFRTVEGADCFVQDFVFQKNPFRIIRRLREFGDSWTDVKPAVVSIYALDQENLQLKEIDRTLHRPICDVRELPVATNHQSLITNLLRRHK